MLALAPTPVRPRRFTHQDQQHLRWWFAGGVALEIGIPSTTLACMDALDRSTPDAADASPHYADHAAAFTRDATLRRRLGQLDARTLEVLRCAYTPAEILFRPLATQVAEEVFGGSDDQGHAFGWKRYIELRPYPTVVLASPLGLDAWRNSRAKSAHWKWLAALPHDSDEGARALCDVIAADALPLILAAQDAWGRT